MPIQWYQTRPKKTHIHTKRHKLHFRSVSSSMPGQSTRKIALTLLLSLPVAFVGRIVVLVSAIVCAHDRVDRARTFVAI